MIRDVIKDSKILGTSKNQQEGNRVVVSKKNSSRKSSALDFINTQGKSIIKACEKNKQNICVNPYQLNHNDVDILKDDIDAISLMIENDHHFTQFDMLATLDKNSLIKKVNLVDCSKFGVSCKIQVQNIQKIINIPIRKFGFSLKCIAYPFVLEKIEKLEKIEIGKIVGIQLMLKIKLCKFLQEIILGEIEGRVELKMLYGLKLLQLGDISEDVKISGAIKLETIKAGNVYKEFRLKYLKSLKNAEFGDVDAKISIGELGNLKTLKAGHVNKDLELNNLPSLETLEFNDVDAKILLGELVNLKTLKVGHVYKDLELNNLPSLETLELMCVGAKILLGELVNLKTLKAGHVNKDLELNNLPSLETLELMGVDAKILLGELVNLKTFKAGCVKKEFNLEKCGQLQNFIVEKMSTDINFKDHKSLKSIKMESVDYCEIKLENIESLEEICFGKFRGTLYLKNIKNLKKLNIQDWLSSSDRVEVDLEKIRNGAECTIIVKRSSCLVFY